MYRIFIVEDDAAIASIKQIPHVAAATPYAQAYNLEGTITAGRNDRYTMEIYNLIGIDPTALEPMGFALQSGSWLTNTPASEKAAKLQILVGGSTGYEFQDSRKSPNSPKRYRWQGQTDANGKELPPFVDIDKDKMTLTIRTGEGSTEKTRSWELEVVGGGGTLGRVTVTDPGVQLLLADGVTAQDVSVSLELPERYVLGASPEVYAVYTVSGGDKQESMGVRVPAVITGLDELLDANVGRELETASDVRPAKTAGMLILISLACTAAAAVVTVGVMRLLRRRNRKTRKR